MTSQRIWIISEIYYPVKTSTGYYITEIAEYLAVKGLDIHVICTGSFYNESEINVALQEDDFCNGVHVHRVFVGNIDKNNLLKRTLRLLWSSFRIFLRILSLIRQRDKLLIVTNPAFLILLMPYIKWRKKIEYTILVHDIFPENLVAIRKIAPSSLIYKFLKKVFDISYGKASSCISIGRDMSEVLKSKIGKDLLIHFIPIWAENKSIFPLDKKETDLCKYLHLESKFVFQFAGNLGHAQGMDNLLKAIERIDNPDIHFLFIGGGAKYNQIETFSQRCRLHNVSLVGFQDRSRQNDFLNACDIGLVTLGDGMYGLGVPSKSYNIMATGKPILMIGEADSEIALCIKEFNLGWVVEPDNPIALKDMFESVYESRDQLPSIRNNARCVADTVFAKETILDKYYRLFK